MINKAILLGRVGSKKFKPTKNGSVICMLSIATNKKYVGPRGDTVQKTTWHFVNCFNKLGEIANNILNVGDVVYIEGEIDHQKETDTDKIHYAIVANLIQKVPTEKRDQSSSQNPNYPSESCDANKVSDIPDDESIPF